ncbi:MAG: 4-hydroxy-tetrahydrodipicolinate reductase [Archaeoglobi archaeon]|nr:4-hydroxy-tetrahydrodipicolinate reductase [Candidatus Mnemosynella bozhongmuii]MDK2781157.1 4-hydroxy-tetrahydrodipicolinate reductase [Archaeoglobi archaeon]
MIRVAVNGIMGRMGRLIAEKVREEEDLELVAGFDVLEGEIAGIRVSSPAEYGRVLSTTPVDVIVDFSTPEASIKIAEIASERGIPLVIGTTGFSEDDLRKIQEFSGRIPVVLSPNFALGVNVFWHLIEEIEKYLGDWDKGIVEIHHRHKKDAPSGTAKKIAELSRASSVHSLRIGDVVGDHIVIYAGEGERIELIHRAQSRMAFVSGALRALRWVAGRSPGLYDMRDVLGL